MHSPIKDILLVSDLDGTLIGKDFIIPERNKQAIARFKQLGGHFSIATGRSAESGRRYIADTAPTAPCILLNGGMIYDYGKEEVLWSLTLPDSCVSYIQRIYDRFPGVGIEVYGTHSIRFLRTNSYAEAHIAHEHLQYTVIGFDEIEFPIYKALFAMDASLVKEVANFTDTFDHPGARFVSSSGNYLEMLPEHANKGTALKELIKIMGIDINNCYAIGDYYNDVELIEAAGHGVMPENAPEELKAQAELIVGHCEQGAVADLIEILEK